MSDRLGTDENWRFESRVLLTLGYGTFAVFLLLVVMAWWFW